MTDIITLFANNLEEVFHDIKRIENSSIIIDDNPTNSIFWFRGQEDHSWNLVPSLYRKLNYEPLFWDELKTEENNILHEFRTRNYHLIAEHTQINDYLWLAYMQHYRLATRLMDWSEQAMISLFFALEKYFKTNDESTGILPCVWMLNPKIMIDKIKIKCYNCKKRIKEKCPDFITAAKNIPPNFISLYHNKPPTIQENFIPIPAISPYNNANIHAQRGVFVLFPNSYNCMSLEQKNDHFPLEKFDGADKFLYKIILTKPFAISQELKLAGMKRSLIYPEIPEVSQEIEQEYLLDKGYK